MVNGNGNGLIPGLGMTAARGLSCSVLTSGQTVTLVFNVATPSEILPGGKIAISFPASGMKSLRSAIHKAIYAADVQRGWISDWMVGNPDDTRNLVAVTFERPPNEVPFLLEDVQAKELAKDIMNNIMGRMDAAERAKLATGIAIPKRGLILPGK